MPGQARLVTRPQPGAWGPRAPLARPRHWAPARTRIPKKKAFVFASHGDDSEPAGPVAPGGHEAHTAQGAFIFGPHMSKSSTTRLGPAQIGATCMLTAQGCCTRVQPKSRRLRLARLPTGTSPNSGGSERGFGHHGHTCACPLVVTRVRGAAARRLLHGSVDRAGPAGHA